MRNSRIRVASGAVDGVGAGELGLPADVAAVRAHPELAHGIRYAISKFARDAGIA